MSPGLVSAPYFFRTEFAGLAMAGEASVTDAGCTRSTVATYH